MPYIEHPRAVVAQLKAWGMTEEANPVPLALAWGHDLVEDTCVPAIAQGDDRGIEAPGRV